MWGETYRGTFSRIKLQFNSIYFYFFGGYNFNKSNIDAFLENVGQILDKNISKIENFLLLGDFKSEVPEQSLSNFYETYNLENIIDETTCDKKPL